MISNKLGMVIGDNYEDELRKLKESGFDYFSFCGGFSGGMLSWRTEKELYKIREKVKNSKVKLFSVHLREAILEAGNLLINTHLNDNFGLYELHLPPGIGTINWLEVIAALDKISYPNPMIFEAGIKIGKPPVPFEGSIIRKEMIKALRRDKNTISIDHNKEVINLAK